MNEQRLMKLGKKESTREVLQQKLVRAKTLMDRDGTSALTVAILAREAGLSESHFFRCFRQLFGVSPYRYCLGQKVARSTDLLTSTPLALTTIAYQVGFSELAAFSRRFKKEHGVSPGYYKRKLKHCGHS